MYTFVALPINPFTKGKFVGNHTQFMGSLPDSRERDDGSNFVLISPQDRQPEFVDGRNQARHVLGDELAQYLVPLCRVRLAADHLAELPLHGAEGGLDVAPLVVMGEIG